MFEQATKIGNWAKKKTKKKTVFSFLIIEKKQIKRLYFSISYSFSFLLRREILIRPCRLFSLLLLLLKFFFFVAYWVSNNRNWNYFWFDAQKKKEKETSNDFFLLYTLFVNNSIIWREKERERQKKNSKDQSCHGSLLSFVCVYFSFIFFFFTLLLY